MPQRNARRWMIAAGLVVVAAAVAGAWFLERKVPRVTTASTATPIAAQPAPAQGGETDVTIPSESLDRLHLAFGQVTQGRLSVEVRVPGTVQPNAYREVHVTPLTGGVITEVSAELGQTVKRGQMLVQVFSNELAEAQTQFIAVSTELEAEHKKLDRTQQLVRLGAASLQELETVEADHHVHEAHVGAARQKLLLFGLNDAQIDQVNAGRQVSSNIGISAPGDGVVTARSANRGQVVALGQELFTITDLETVWLEGSLFENDFGAVRVGSKATITTPAYAGRTYRGAVSYVDPRVDPQTRTAKVRVELANPGLALRLGMYMDMSFETSGNEPMPVVPKQAVQTIGSNKVVYLPAEEGRFLQRTVKIGEELAGGFRVLEGLKPGDKVVTEGSVLLRAEALRQHP